MISHLVDVVGFYKLGFVFIMNVGSWQKERRFAFSHDLTTKSATRSTSNCGMVRWTDGGTDVFDRRLLLGAQSRTGGQAADARSQALATTHRIHPGFLPRTQLAQPSSVRDSGAMLKLIPRI